MKSTTTINLYRESSSLLESKPGYFIFVLNDAFSATRVYEVDDRVTSE
jgi:hypothetical protein